ncbi:MAG: hypothetical protein IIB09_03410 [Bacteroidetes bacterium]|nr:hypothetical protein [Bacteroidota bacterium]
MNTNQSSSAFRRLVTAMAVFTLFALAASVANAQQPGHQARMAEHAEHMVSNLRQELNLTAAQVELFEKSIASGPQPGALWSLAAELEPTLTDAQKALLFTRPERDGQRPQRGGQRPDFDVMHEAEQQARDRVLGLSDQQSRQLDDIHEQRRAEREQAHEQMMEQMRRNLGGRPEPGELPNEMAAILTPDQQEIVKVFHALRGRLHGSRGGRGQHGFRGGFGDDGPRRGR